MFMARPDAEWLAGASGQRQADDQDGVCGDGSEQEDDERVGDVGAYVADNGRHQGERYARRRARELEPSSAGPGEQLEIMEIGGGSFESSIALGFIQTLHVRCKEHRRPRREMLPAGRSPP
jgi:hypothetical protein